MAEELRLFHSWVALSGSIFRNSIWHLILPDPESREFSSPLPNRPSLKDQAATSAQVAVTIPVLRRSRMVSSSSLLYKFVLSSRTESKSHLRTWNLASDEGKTEWEWWVEPGGLESHELCGTGDSYPNMRNGFSFKRASSILYSYRSISNYSFWVGNFMRLSRQTASSWK